VEQESAIRRAKRVLYPYGSLGQSALTRNPRYGHFTMPICHDSPGFDASALSG
jgi:hypothetical protein